jgi:hypothetical protein
VRTVVEVHEGTGGDEVFAATFAGGEEEGDVGDLLGQGVDGAIDPDNLLVGVGEELAAPGGDGFGDAIEETLVGVEGEFIEGDMTAFAGEGVGVGGEGIDAAAIGELEDVGGGVGVFVEDDLTQGGGAKVEDFGPASAVFELEFGLELVARRDVGVQACLPGADQENKAEGVGEGKTYLAGFEGDFERGVVENPVALGLVEVFVEVFHKNFGDNW